MVKIVGVHGIVTFVIAFIGIVLMLPTINAIVNSVSTYLTTEQLVVAGLIGVVLIIAAFKNLIAPAPPGYNYG